MCFSKVRHSDSDKNCQRRTYMQNIKGWFVLDMVLSNIAHERYSLKFDASALETSFGSSFGYPESLSSSSNIFSIAIELELLSAETSCFSVGMTSKRFRRSSSLDALMILDLISSPLPASKVKSSKNLSIADVIFLRGFDPSA